MTTNILKKLLVLSLAVPSLGQAQFTTISTGTSTSLTVYNYNQQVIVSGTGDYFASANEQGNGVTLMKSPSASPFVNRSLCAGTTALYALTDDFSASRYQLKKSIDGGNVWSTMFDTTGVYLLAFKMVTPAYGVAAGLFGAVVITTDSGQHWITTRPDTKVDQYTTINSYGNTVILGGTEGGIEYFYKTTDMGATWTKSPAMNNSGFTSSAIHFVNATTVMATSIDRNPYEAFICKSTDGGNTWTNISLGNNKAYYDVKFLNENEGYAVGAIYGTDTTGIIAKTTDGGATWTEIKTTYAAEFTSIVLVNPTTAFIAGTNGTLVKWDMNAVATGINTISDATEVNVYPNPATAQLNYTLSADATYTSAQIFSVTGQLVIQNIRVQKDHSQVDVSALAPGQYFLVLHDNSIAVTTKTFFKD